MDEPAIEAPSWVGDESVDDEPELEAEADMPLLEREIPDDPTPLLEYSFEMPKGLHGDVDTESNEYNAFIDIARRDGISNDTAQELFSLFAQYQHDNYQAPIDYDAQEQQLGVDAAERIAFVTSFGQNELSEDDNRTLESMAQTADQLDFIERMIKRSNGMIQASQPSYSPAQKNTPEQANMLTQKQFARIVKSQKYMEDKNYRNSILKQARTAGW
ncbi:MAG: hypothetical protein KZQ70_15190 [gamma proteobacterium symbiont of Lucinoma myriamae]|nr:hypothetical protein [gamma proteobacterium symbiont of Lucinoma myriamae]MCU7833538.1 hypothetical protein [gamma proteobacterium symbiont of Lucinoma myriamae]